MANYDKALKEGKMDARLAYAWLQDDPERAKRLLTQLAKSKGLKSIYELFPGSKGDLQLPSPDDDGSFIGGISDTISDGIDFIGGDSGKRSRSTVSPGTA